MNRENPFFHLSEKKSIDKQNEIVYGSSLAGLLQEDIIHGSREMVIDGKNLNDFLRRFVGKEIKITVKKVESNESLDL